MIKIIKTVLIEGQLLGILIGSAISFLFYRLSKNDSKETQMNIWKKEFDRYQTEPIIAIFRDILSILNCNVVARTKAVIPQETVNRLKIELQLIRYFGKALKDKIEKNIYNDCLEYNKIIYEYSQKLSAGSSPTDQDIFVNESKVEKQKRESIEKYITEIVDEIKSIYSEF